MDNETVFFLMMVVGSVVSFVMLLRHLGRDRARTARTVGEVIGHAPNPSRWCGNPSRTAHAVIRYVVDGRTYRCVSSIGASWIIDDVGDTVEVGYDPRQPDSADVLSHTTRSLHQALVVIIPLVGIGFAIAAAVNLQG